MEVDSQSSYADQLRQTGERHIVPQEIFVYAPGGIAGAAAHRRELKPLLQGRGCLHRPPDAAALPLPYTGLLGHGVVWEGRPLRSPRPSVRAYGRPPDSA